jgi:hypothetical protein
MKRRLGAVERSLLEVVGGGGNGAEVGSCDEENESVWMFGCSRQTPLTRLSKTQRSLT